VFYHSETILTLSGSGLTVFSDVNRGNYAKMRRMRK
jgi:hypothetical protein